MWYLIQKPRTPAQSPRFVLGADLSGLHPLQCVSQESNPPQCVRQELHVLPVSLGACVHVAGERTLFGSESASVASSSATKNTTKSVTVNAYLGQTSR
eukprot:1184963-Rhodomonas_salina.3